MSGARIIVKKKKGGHGGHHGGAWKVAYADFVTAMMAFFLVMWILGLSESSRKSIAGYFREPGIFSFTTGKALPEKIEVTPRSERSGDGSGGVAQAKNDVVHFQRSCGGPTQDESKKIGGLKAEVARQLAALVAKRPELAKLAGAVDLNVTSEGLRIELSETRDVAYFDVGGARPSRAALDVLAAIAPALGSLPNLVVIEGHTDRRSYPRGATYTNWELSADRANAARKLLLEHGVAPRQLASVTGYADTRLRKPEEPHDISNRRVSVVVKYQDSDEPPVLEGAPASPGTEPGEPGEAPGEPVVPPIKEALNLVPDLRPTAVSTR